MREILTDTAARQLAALEAQLTAAQLALAEVYEGADAQATSIMLAQTEVYETVLTLQKELQEIKDAKTHTICNLAGVFGFLYHLHKFNILSV